LKSPSHEFFVHILVAGNRTIEELVKNPNEAELQNISFSKNRSKFEPRLAGLGD
jgi:hypothetical protein